MTGGILQLVAKGYGDLYLINDPEITYFKIMYRRHTNFAIFPRTLKFKQNLTFGKLAKCPIPRIADLLYKLYFVVDIPKIRISYKTTTRSNIASILSTYEIEYIYDNDATLSNTDKIEIINLIKDKITELVELNDIENLQKISVLNSKYCCWEFKSGCELWDKIYWMIDNNLPKHAWVPELGHYLIEYIKIDIGGVTFDMHTSEILHCLHNITDNKNIDYNKLIGNTPDLYTYDNKEKNSRRLYIPLAFWFNRYIQCSLPLVAMQYTDIEINIKIRDFADVFYYDTNAVISGTPKIKTKLLGHFFYLEKEERKTICTNKLEYLYEYITFSKDYIINSKMLKNVNIDFNEEKYNSLTNQEIIDQKLLDDVYIELKTFFDMPVKYLFFVIKPLNNNNNTWNDFNIKVNNQIINPIKSYKIKFNGRDRETRKESDILHLTQPYYSNASLNDNIFMYKYALFPHELQPSGAANYSQLADSSVILYPDPIMTRLLLTTKLKFKITIYADNLNILRVFSGMAGQAFVCK